MTNPDIMRARAKRLYDEAQKIDDPGKRLAQVLRAVELEAEAEALAREHGAIPKPPVLDVPTGSATGRANP
jgi:hypothetical protein